MNCRITVGLGLVSSILLSAPAWAQQWPTQDPAYSAPDPSLAAPEAFGAAGTIAITSDFDIDLRRITESFRGNSESATQIHVTPSLLMFLAPNFAVGGMLNFQHDSFEQPDASLTKLGVGPLAAYNVNISPRASLLPTVGLLYTWAKASATNMGGRQSATGYEISMILRAPVLLHPFPHVFVGATPFVEFDLVSKAEDMDVAKTRTFGVTLDLGLWF